MPDYKIYRGLTPATLTEVESSKLHRMKPTVDIGQAYYWQIRQGSLRSSILYGGMFLGYELSAAKRISVPQTVNNNFDMSGAWSYVGWMKMNPTANTNTAIVFQRSSTHVLQLTIQNTELLQFIARVSAGTDEVAKEPNTITTQNEKLSKGTTYCIGLTVGSKGEADIKLYINNEEVDFFDVTVQPLTSDLSFSGIAWSMGGLECVSGPFTLFNKELSLSEYRTVYNNGLPLRDPSSIGNVVAHYPMYDDTEAGGIYTINDKSGNGNNAVTTGTSGTEQVSMTEFRGFSVPGQEYIDSPRGRIIKMANKVNYGAHFSSIASYAPFFEYCRYPSAIIYVNGKFYIGGGSGGYLGHSDEVFIVSYDPVSRMVSTPVFFGVKNVGSLDGHMKPTLIQKQGSNNILVAFEEKHGDDTVLIYEFNTSDHSITALSTITSANRFDYPQFFYLGSRLYLLGRGEGDMNESGYMYSDDDGATWFDGYEITDNITDRSLKFIPWLDTSEFNMIVMSVLNTDTKYVHHDSAHVKSINMEDFTDSFGNNSKDITSVAITHAEISNPAIYNLRTLATADQGYQHYSAQKDDNGRPIILYGNNQTNVYELGYYNDSNVWTIKILSAITPDTTIDYKYNSGQPAHAALVYKGGDNFDIFTTKLIVDYHAMIKLSTDDFGDSFTESEPLSPPKVDIFYPRVHFNNQRGEITLIAANAQDKRNNQRQDLFLYSYTPEDLTPVAGDPFDNPLDFDAGLDFDKGFGA